MSTYKRELLFDGDIRGYRTGKDCVLELAKNPLWKTAEPLTEEELTLVANEEMGYLDIIDDFIDTTTATIDGNEYRLEWDDGSIFAVTGDAPEDHNETNFED